MFEEVLPQIRKTGKYVPESRTDVSYYNEDRSVDTKGSTTIAGHLEILGVDASNRILKIWIGTRTARIFKKEYGIEPAKLHGSRNAPKVYPLRDHWMIKKALKDYHTKKPPKLIGGCIMHNTKSVHVRS